MKNLIFVLMLFAGIEVSFAQKVLTASDAGSSVHFVIKNFGIKSSGDFTGLKATIKFDPKSSSDWSLDATVNAASVNTGNDARDRHLKKSDYFDVTKFPLIHMVSTRIDSDGNGGYTFAGNLTIKGKTRPVQFPFKVNKSKDGYLFTGTFDLNRRDFEVGGNSVSLSDELTVKLSVFAK